MNLFTLLFMKLFTYLSCPFVIKYCFRLNVIKLFEAKDVRINIKKITWNWSNCCIVWLSFNFRLANNLLSPVFHNKITKHQELTAKTNIWWLSYWCMIVYIHWTYEQLVHPYPGQYFYIHFHFRSVIHD